MRCFYFVQALLQWTFAFFIDLWLNIQITSYVITIFTRKPIIILTTALFSFLKENSSIIWQKGESQNGSLKKTKHTEFSEKRIFLTCLYAQVRVYNGLTYWQSLLWNILHYFFSIVHSIWQEYSDLTKNWEKVLLP